jgi:hypothetical protein
MTAKLRVSATMSWKPPISALPLLPPMRHVISRRN